MSSPLAVASASAKAGGVAKGVVDAVVRSLVCGWGGSLREVEGAEERGVGAGVEGFLGGALGGVVE